MGVAHPIVIHNAALRMVIFVPASVLLMGLHVLAPTERLTMHSSLLKKEHENYSTSRHGDDSSLAVINNALNAP